MMASRKNAVQYAAGTMSSHSITPTVTSTLGITARSYHSGLSERRCLGTLRMCVYSTGSGAFLGCPYSDSIRMNALNSGDDW